MEFISCFREGPMLDKVVIIFAKSANEMILLIPTAHRNRIREWRNVLLIVVFIVFVEIRNDVMFLFIVVVKFWMFWIIRRCVGYWSNINGCFISRFPDGGWFV